MHVLLRGFVRYEGGRFAMKPQPFLTQESHSEGKYAEARGVREQLGRRAVRRVLS